MQLYTRYKPARERRWPVRFFASLILLGLAIAGWLSWQPRKREDPQQFFRAPKPPTTRTPSAQSNLPAAKLPPTRAPGPPPALVRPPLTGTSTPSPATPTPMAGLPRPAAPGTQKPRPAAADSGWPARPAASLLDAQIALAGLGLSPGSIDGVGGSRTRNAVRAFQQQQQLRPSGELDALTKQRLVLTEPPYTNRVVTSNDLARLLPAGRSWLEKSRQPRLDYENLLELTAEQSRADPDFIRQLNQNVDWTNVTAGTRLLVPNVRGPACTNKAAFVRIQLANRILQAFDDRTNLMAHFLCSVARNVDQRPVGELHVAMLVTNPNYTFDPANFPLSAEARQLKTKLVIPPGPNNPVGVAWIGLDKPGYGIHGTPRPEQVGQAESLGCFRLANWNAECLLELSWIGMPVYVEP